MPRGAQELKERRGRRRASADGLSSDGDEGESLTGTGKMRAMPVGRGTEAQEDYSRLWLAHQKFLRRVYVFIVFVMLCVSGMIVFFLWSPRASNALAQEKRFLLFMSLPLFALTTVLLILFRSEPRLNILILQVASGVTGYAMGFVSLALFKSIDAAVN